MTDRQTDRQTDARKRPPDPAPAHHKLAPLRYAQPRFARLRFTRYASEENIYSRNANRTSSMLRNGVDPAKLQVFFELG